MVEDIEGGTTQVALEDLEAQEEVQADLEAFPVEEVPAEAEEQEEVFNKNMRKLRLPFLMKKRASIMLETR